MSKHNQKNPNQAEEVEMQAGKAEMLQRSNCPQILATERQNNLRKYGIILETGHHAEAVMAAV